MNTTTKFANTSASKEIKNRLKKAFPGIKFSVRYESFAGGDAIDVRWQFGPAPSDVEKIVKPFQHGSFDSMTDSYDYQTNKEVNPDGSITIIAGVKWVKCSREIPMPFREEFYKALCKHEGIEYVDYYTMIHGLEVCTHAHRILYNTQFSCSNAAFISFTATPWDNDLHHHYGDNFLIQYEKLA